MREGIEIFIGLNSLLIIFAIPIFDIDRRIKLPLALQEVYNLSLFDHFRRRSDNATHTFGNNKDVTPVMVGQITQVIINSK